jgi:LCP family protein required for cell wall assembly
MSPERGDDRPPERPEGPERPEKPERPEYTVYGAGGRRLGKKRAPKREQPPEEGKPPETEAKPQPAEGEPPETEAKPQPEDGEPGEGKPSEQPPPPDDEPAAPAAPTKAPRPGKPEYRVYRSRPSLRDRFRKPDFGSLRRPSPGLRDRLSGAGGGRRWLRWVLIGVAAWFAISFIAFAISAQTQKGKLPDSAKQALEGGPDLLAGQNVLILGGDRRGERQSKASGIEAQGPPRADTIMVLHAALTSFRKLSIPRDTHAAIPNCGEQRINASLACNTNSRDGNPASTIRTVEEFLGIPIHHIVIIDFDGFADFINTIGGVTIDVPREGRRRGPVVCGDVDGGRDQGGVSLKLTAGEHALEGDKALAFARLRNNRCNPSEDDTARAARQQLVLNGIKGRLTSPLRLPYNFVKGPWIGWNAPKAFVSDMGGFTLPQVAIAAIFGGSGESNVLGRDPDGDINATPGPGGSIFIGEGECRRAVEELTGSDPRQDPTCSPG